MKGCFCPRRFAAAFLCAVLLAAALALPAAADSESQTVRIGYIDYEGFIDRTTDGRYTGYGVEYLNRVSRYTGWQYQYVYGGWDELLQKLSSGEIDFLCHAQKTPEREAEYLFSAYSSGSESSLLYARLDDDRYYYNDYENFNGIRVALLRSSFQNITLASYANTHGFSYTPVYYDTPNACMEALDSGEVDAAGLGSLAGRSGYRVVGRFGSDPFYFITSPQNTALMASLDDAQAEIFSGDPYYLSSLYKKYYGDAAAESTLLLTREEAAYIENSGAVTVGLLPGLKPLSWQDENGTAHGVIHDLMELVAQKAGLHFTYDFLASGQPGVDYLQNGGGQLVAGVTASLFSTPNSALLISDPLLTSSVSFAGKTGSPFDPHTPFTLALPVGFIGGRAALSALYPDVDFFETNDMADSLDAIRDGDADVYLQNTYVLREALQSPLYEGLTVYSAYSFDEDICAVTLPENALLLSIINKAVSVISTSELDQILVENTAANAYQYTLADFFYKYRRSIVIIVALICSILFLVFYMLYLRTRAYNEIKAANLRLSEAVDRADRASQAKTQFLARMSHEIRTPINAIVGLTEVARHHSEEPARVISCLDKVDSSSRVLLDIVNDVLDVSAMEKQKLRLDLAPFDLDVLLKNLSTIYETQCRERGVTFALHIDIQTPRVVGDPVRVSQILLNLISNAAKFTPAGGVISVSARQTGMHDGLVDLCFTVSDTGCGISEEMLPRLFLPFEQENLTASARSGSGLGLSIAKGLVDLMHGGIQVQSQKGKGSVFVVTLSFPPAAPKPKDAEHFDFTGRRLLLAEDDPLNQEIAVELLRLTNARVDCAGNGHEALERFSASAPGYYDAVLLDIQMPVMDGYEAARRIRALPRPDAKTIPLYSMTANGSVFDEAAASAGMNGSISKPIDTTLLYKTLQRGFLQKD